MYRNSKFFVLLLFLCDSCINELNTPPEGFDEDIIVIEGLITDQPGPYTVKLFIPSGSQNVLDDVRIAPVKEVAILDSEGIQEVLQNAGGGVYRTDPLRIRGEVGKSYSIRVVLLDGSLFESVPQELKAVSEIESLYAEWESVLPLNGPTQYGFKIFVDSRLTGDANKYVRWKFSGAYEVHSFPHLNWSMCNCCEDRGFPRPYPCSGYEYTGFSSFLEKVGDCDCCTCWVSDFENKPHLNDHAIVTDGVYKKVEVGYVPFNQWTFGNRKYMVKVEQMSLSKEVFEYWSTIKDQKEGITSLFQPSFGRLGTNLFSSNSNKRMVGVFQVSAVTKRILFLNPDDAPLPVPPYDIDPPIENCVLWRPCTTIFPNSSTTPPADWE